MALALDLVTMWCLLGEEFFLLLVVFVAAFFVFDDDEEFFLLFVVFVAAFFVFDDDEEFFLLFVVFVFVAVFFFFAFLFLRGKYCSARLMAQFLISNSLLVNASELSSSCIKITPSCMISANAWFHTYSTLLMSSACIWSEQKECFLHHLLILSCVCRMAVRDLLWAAAKTVVWPL